ncbi:hypothetical protein DTO271G3_3377 [Paecilomyces variotii]|nr:hypothetical protein DTO271G3_3377 [Paecilomyces variotii]
MRGTCPGQSPSETIANAAHLQVRSPESMSGERTSGFSIILSLTPIFGSISQLTLVKFPARPSLVSTDPFLVSGAQQPQLTQISPLDPPRDGVAIAVLSPPHLFLPHRSLSGAYWSFIPHPVQRSTPFAPSIVIVDSESGQWIRRCEPVMEALVYEDSPLADYLQGAGERSEDWIPQEADNDTSSDTRLDFAPRGISTFQERIRNKLPAPLDLTAARKTGALGKIHDACSFLVSSRVGRSDNERFLEKFGYLIVASQLLNEHSPPSYTSAADVLSKVPAAQLPSLSETFGLQGVVFTAATSFSVAWLMHWSRSKSGSGFNTRRVAVLLILLPVIALVFYAFTRRQWLKYVRHQAVEAAAVLVSNARSFDSAASASVVFVQEVELVSRGYRMSTPLPPVSRLEENAQTRRCMRLRRALSESLFSLLERYIQAQKTLQPLAESTSLEKYYDIYELSFDELLDAQAGLRERGAEDQYSLRSLRTLFGRLYTVRKSILCCLLALSADGGNSDIPRWSAAVEEMRDLATVTGNNVTRISNILNEQDRDIIPPSPLPNASPSRDSFRAQFRKLNSLSQSIRALHAKMHVIREESDASLEQKGNESDFMTSLMTQYESIGADIRGLLQEWEAGKSALIAGLERSSSSDRSSRPTSSLKSPMSPTFSLSGSTEVEGSPADALKLLEGDSQPYLNPDYNMDDEEVFEAIALPVRKRASLTREERIARVKEDRAKQAAAREKTDANTNMLKELETVIKHRPRTIAAHRVTSI